MLSKRFIKVLHIMDDIGNGFICKYYLTTNPFLNDDNKETIAYGVCIEKMSANEEILEENTYSGFSEDMEATINIINTLAEGRVTPYTLAEVLDEIISS